MAPLARPLQIALAVDTHPPCPKLTRVQSGLSIRVALPGGSPDPPEPADTFDAAGQEAPAQ
jgi:hypothetical protein